MNQTAIVSQRIVLFVAPPGSVSGGLLHALERELPGISATQVATPGQARTRFAIPVSLIVFDPACSGQIALHMPALARAHPSARTAVMQVGRDSLPARKLVASGTVQSVLPMDVRLDVWLTVIRLLLCGGEYLPAGFFHPSETLPGSGPSAPSATDEEEAGTRDINRLHRLTAREAEILKMLSRGLQNKVIAARLGLSEFTVKAHVHNLIAKLGVHNRTEAAAVFHAGGTTLPTVTTNGGPDVPAATSP